MSELFLGLDSSTQSLTAIIIDLASRKIVHQSSVNFDAALPLYGTKNGVLRDGGNPRVVHAPPLIWVEALDLLLERMKKEGAPLGEIRAIAGSGQQHGSVYLNRFAADSLAKPDPARPLRDNLDHIFSRATSPVWMDSSTTLECDEITAGMGGRAALIEATGSAAFERFTGPQIRKFAEWDPSAYGDTAHIALVSSFMASILTGRIAPVDPGDGAGMNLMNIRTRQWHEMALAATAPGLETLLPPLVPSWQIIGPVHGYFVKKFGFAADAQCVVWSGDNPCSVIGLGLVEAGQTAISLGTSDTYFGTMSGCRTDPNGEGHVFGSPAGGYMTLICFKNGSLAREKIRDEYRMSWKEFSTALRATPPGNNGAIMLPWFDPEITPRVLRPGIVRKKLSAADAAANCRAVVEGQMLAMRLHSSWMGVRPTRIFATGGASANVEITQIMADVLGCPVSRIETTASAALGAALRAAHAWHKAADEIAWPEIVRGFTGPAASSRVEPRPEFVPVYDAMLGTYESAELGALGRR
jgi:xylulokinase